MGLVLNHPRVAQEQEKKVDDDVPVQDSNFLENVSYDATNRQMTVTMKQGGQYVYSDVPADVMGDFKESKDKGSYYANFIKGQYGSARTINKTVGKKVKK